ncbi:nucleotidyltransferase domain-containing protein [Legionella spiritensis]|uniref:Polymerase nucleotidyl transferase domain-containing protein n=1 Tax=Legionella spiritensis TaxID=452 RepID=A0A0W0YZ83_LEGSP|nr:nucleotidyltransferase domain-containing protein [Legionella spiritensis]KTD61891.1 hypothetical protein Lspi_2521 [Legionella spiritensis]SNV31249.1 Uncharacterised protein [Legionella spiritensis]
MYIYAFGSICRGEIDAHSDIDLLAITENFSKFDPLVFSIYTPKRIQELWKQGNPFAWHLYYEAKMLYSHDGNNYISELGIPSKYNNCIEDCFKFHNIFREAKESLEINSIEIYDISLIFLSIRNIASCYSLGVLKSANFSRNAAYFLGEKNIPIPHEAYSIFERARILATRGKGSILSQEEVGQAKKYLDILENWMLKLISHAKREL